MLAVSSAILLSLLPIALPLGVPVGPGVQGQVCVTMRTEQLPLDQRRSPLDSVSFMVGNSPVKICYSRPSARGRTMIGGSAAPYGEIWRTGANEPTMIHTGVPLNIAGIRIPAGTFSIYTVPGDGQWQVIVNRSISQWGHERFYTEEVRAQEVGRSSVPSERLDRHVEQLTIRAQPASEDNVILILEWERTQVVVPISKN